MKNSKKIIELSEKNKNILKITIIGSVSSFMILLMIYVAFAQFFISYILGSISQKYTILFILLGMFFISLISNIIVSYFLLGNVKLKSYFLSSIYSFVFTIATIIIISYVSLFLYYPEVFDGLIGLDYIYIMPLTIIYFTIYILPVFIYLFIIEVLLYYVYFIVFFINMYEEKEVIPKKQGNYF